MNRGPGGPMANGKIESAKDFKGTFKTLISHFKNYKKWFIIVLFFTTISTIFSIVGPSMAGDVVTELYNGLIGKITNTGGIDFDSIQSTLLLLIGIYIISAISTFIVNIISNTITNDIAYKFRKNISIKLNKVPMSFFDKYNHGEILSKITNDVDTLSQNLSQAVSSSITSFATIIGILIMMFSIDITMSLVTLLILPISLFGMGLIVKKSQKYFLQQQQNLGEINGIVEEIYGGHNIVKVFNGEEKSLDQFNEVNNKLYKSGWKSQVISTAMQPLMQFIGNLGYVVICLLGSLLIIKDKLEVGSIITFSQYSRSLNSSISQIAQIITMIQSTMAAAERIFEFLDEEEETPNIKDALSIKNIKGDVEFKDVVFGYNENKIIINDFSATVKKGQKIAIVGPTGAGKTTIVKLLMRFYDLNRGSILIDGKDITKFKREDLRSLFGMVLQDAWLYSDTVLNNIKYGKLDANDEEVKNASKAACVHHFIKTLPEGYDMIINEESDNVSLGQKQLLTIARVILADPKILILDEATSSVDTRTEILIQQGMDKLMENRTSFIIAHRLSTIKNADLILVMNNGDIVETGNHKDLLKKNGFYANLYNSQFEEV